MIYAVADGDDDGDDIHFCLLILPLFWFCLHTPTSATTTSNKTAFGERPSGVLFLFGPGRVVELTFCCFAVLML